MAATNSSIAETGSAMSCLTFAPSLLCASGIDSRRCHIALACSIVLASAASSTRPRSIARPSSDSMSPVACAWSSTSECSISTVHGDGGERTSQLRKVAAHEVERKPVHDLEPREPRAEAFVREREQRGRGGDRRQGRHRRRDRGGARVQLQRRRGDDRERSFAADQEVAQVVAGVVLAQAREAVPDATFGGDRLDAETELARVAVADDLRAAGVRRQVAADGAAALGGEAEREQQVVRRRGFLHALQHATRFGDERQVGAVDAADAVHARGREDDLRSARIGNRGTDEAGVAALRDDRSAVRATRHDHRGDLGGRRRADDRERAPLETTPPIDLVWRAIVADEHLRCADRGAQIVEQAHVATRAAAPAPAGAPARARSRRRRARAKARSRPRRASPPDLARSSRAPRLRRRRARPRGSAIGRCRGAGARAPAARRRAAAPSAPACRGRSARARAPRRRRARSARGRQRPPAPATVARRRSRRQRRPSLLMMPAMHRVPGP